MMEFALVKTKARPFAHHALNALAGFLLGSAPIAGGVMPFGISLLCAVPKDKRRDIFAGALLASLLDDCVPLSAFCAVYLFAVLTAKEKHGGVFLYTRVLLALSVSALRATYIAVNGVSSIQAVFSLIASVISYPFLTYAFRGYFDKQKELHRKRFELSLLAFAFAFTAVLAPFELFGVNLGIIPAAVFTLCVARSRGFAFGGACGVVCGLISGGAAIGALGVVGMVYGLLAPEIEILALILAYMLSVSGYYYLAGVETTVAAAGMLLAVCALFWPLRKKIPLGPPSPSAEKRVFDRRMTRYAAAFSSLSSLFYTVSDTSKQESVTDLNRRIVTAVDGYCAHCTGCELDKSEISNFFTGELRRNGIATYSRLPTHITHRCPNAMAMAKSVNGLRLMREKESERGLKQMADEYSEISALLLDAAKKQDDSTREDRQAAQKIKRDLGDMKVSCDGVRVTGTRMREVTVYGVTPDKMPCSPREIAGIIAKTTGTRMSEPELILHDDYTLLKSKSIPRFRVECAKFSEAKDGESVCGDTVSVFENDERYFYCLVSDGMGSGRDAALTSKLSAIMLEKLLTVGADKESALRMLNKALNEKQEEVFATVDLLEIDRVLSTATLIKAGAAPTVLLRDGTSSSIESRTPPAGIMQTVIADKKTFSVKKGDMLVMMSDGIQQTGSDEPILPETGIPPMPSAQALASKLLRDARNRSEAADDMSVCVIRIV